MLISIVNTTVNNSIVVNIMRQDVKKMRKWDGQASNVNYRGIAYFASLDDVIISRVLSLWMLQEYLSVSTIIRLLYCIHITAWRAIGKPLL